MTDQNTDSPVRRYARAATNIDAAKIAGQQPDARDVATIVELETMAANLFSPQQIGALGRMVAQERQAYVEQRTVENQQRVEREGMLNDYRQSKAAVLAQALRDNAMRKMTAHKFQEGAPGKAGLTEQQFHDVKDHGMYVHPGAERLRDQIKRQQAEMRGKHVTDADILKAREVASDLWDSTEKERDAKLDAMGVSRDPVERNAYTRRVFADLVSSELRERKEKNAPAESFEPKVIEDTEAQRRAQIMFEVGRHSSNDEIEKVLGDHVPRELLESDGLVGDVARAVEAADPSDDHYAEVEAIAEGRA